MASKSTPTPAQEQKPAKPVEKEGTFRPVVPEDVKGNEGVEPRSADEVISQSNPIDYPLSAPAAKQQADRLEQERTKGFAKPFPVGSNQNEENLAPPAPVQTTDEFQETGGVKVTDNDISKVEENTSGTTEDASKSGNGSKASSTKK